MIYINDNISFQSIPWEAEEFRAELGLDTETTGLHPTTGRLRLIQLFTGRETYIIDCFTVNGELIKQRLGPILEDPHIVKIMHNAKFDNMWLMSALDITPRRIFDTFLASKILSGGLFTIGGHGLAGVVSRYLRRPLNKTSQKSDWSGPLSPEQLAYAAGDVAYLPELRKLMIKDLQRDSLLTCAKIEFDCTVPLAWLTLSGFKLDVASWRKVYLANEESIQQIGLQLKQALADGIPQFSLFDEPAINLNSGPQLRAAFAGIGIELPDSIEGESLALLAHTHPPIKLLMEYKILAKALSSYGEAYLRYVNKQDSRIYADFRQIGTETGRMSCTNPNLHQPPRDQRYRNCFIAEEGNSLISADYAGMELRILADLSRDHFMIEAFRSGADLHRWTASRMFGIPIEQVSSKQRTFAKQIAFGLVYGMGYVSLARKLECEPVYAQQLLDSWFKAYPAVKPWLDYQRRMVLKTREARSYSGRVVRFLWDDADRERTAAIQRNATNTPPQAGNADIIKLALNKLWDNLRAAGYDWRTVKLVNVVHDEIDMEVPDENVTDINERVQRCMIEAAETFMDVPIKVDSHIMKRWEK